MTAGFFSDGGVIRIATIADAEAISALVIRTLGATNAHHYSPRLIREIAANFSPDHVASRFEGRMVWVASIDEAIVGTASLEKNWVRTVFVDPARQGRGVGKALMAELFETVSRAAIEELFVPSSINAEGFYRRLGFQHLRDEFRGEERIILMMRRFGEATGGVS